MAASTETIRSLRGQLLAGAVIPAHPLALTSSRKLDERAQRALTRYYCAAGVGGIAVGVHTTQFAIRRPSVGMLAPVLGLAMEEMRRHPRPLIKVAGVCGTTQQATDEAALAVSIGYDAALVSLAAFPDAPHDTLIEHCREIADIMPVFGFYLQPSVGGRLLDYRFWREFVDIENVVAIKVAPFNRYQTVDVLRAVAASGRSAEVALYTGNDDNIMADLMISSDLGDKPIRFSGGLLGHWAVWTKRAVEQFHAVQHFHQSGGERGVELLATAAAITDANSVLFDVRNRFAGCIPGIHAVLVRQGLMAGTWCLDPDEVLSPGQSDELDRIYRQYPYLTDDEFVFEHRDEWLR